MLPASQAEALPALRHRRLTKKVDADDTYYSMGPFAKKRGPATRRDVWGLGGLNTGRPSESTTGETALPFQWPFVLRAKLSHLSTNDSE
jgi:hypothetical protein